MKRSVTFIFILLFVFNASGQEKISFNKNRDSNLTHLLNNVREYKQFDGKNLSIRLYLVGNRYNESAKNSSETDEISDNLIIAVSEFDESPEQSLFILKDIFAVTDLTLSNTIGNGKLVSLGFSYFDRKVKVRKNYNATISLNKVVAIQ